jgi:prepilin-type N-terminal cleavage/methylation domain-containing protein
MIKMNKKMPAKKIAAFTLIELLIVIVIIGIIAAVAAPGFDRTKQDALSREAIASLKLMAAAQKVYKMESNNNRYVACANAALCNTALSLDLHPSNWLYAVSVNAGTGVATLTATRVGLAACTYTLTSSNFNAEPVKSAGCPAGMQ